MVETAELSECLMRVKKVLYERPSTTIPKLTEALLAAVARVSVSHGTTIIPCGEVMYLRSLLRHGASSRSDLNLVPTIAIRLYTPQVGGRSGVSQQFHDTVDMFGTELTRELARFTTRPDVARCLRECGIRKVITSCRRFFAKGRERIDRAELAFEVQVPLEHSAIKRTYRRKRVAA